MTKSEIEKRLELLLDVLVRKGTITLKDKMDINIGAKEILKDIDTVV